jgi:23S rRNA (guanosine2251-2'-O)-methyltransferase
MKNRRPDHRAANKHPAGKQAGPPKRGGKPVPGAKHSGAKSPGTANRPNRGPQRHPSQGAAEAPRGRDKARWVVGLHSCEETLKIRAAKIRELWLRDDWSASKPLSDIEEKAREKGIPIREKTQANLDQVSSGHQGVALACTENPEVDWAHLKETETALVLLLDGIEDPHNLGSMLRTAWLAGVTAVFTPADRAVGLTPAACKVASGGAEHVPVEADSNLAGTMEQLKEAGFWIYGLAEAGTRKPWEFQLPKKVAWVIGSEGSGIRKSTERACDELVRLPQVETGSSYNASIACAMALAETCRQFGKPE